jgi:hypothetical protein
MTDNYTGCSSDLGFPINEMFRGGGFYAVKTIVKDRTCPWFQLQESITSGGIKENLIQ